MPAPVRPAPGGVGRGAGRSCAGWRTSSWRAACRIATRPWRRCAAGRRVPEPAPVRPAPGGVGRGAGRSCAGWRTSSWRAACWIAIRPWRRCVAAGRREADARVRQSRARRSAPRRREILRWVEDEQLEGRLPDRDSALEAVRRRWAAGGGCPPCAGPQGARRRWAGDPPTGATPRRRARKARAEAAGDSPTERIAASRASAQRVHPRLRAGSSRDRRPARPGPDRARRAT